MSEKNFLTDLKINFNNKKLIDCENYTNKILILKLKNKFFEKKNFFKLDPIGCGGNFSFIYNNSLNNFFI
jgi:hypothetical protein